MCYATVETGEVRKMLPKLHSFTDGFRINLNLRCIQRIRAILDVSQMMAGKGDEFWYCSTEKCNLTIRRINL